LAVAPAVAHADLQLAVGSRVEPFRYTPAYFPNSGFAERPPSQFAGKTGPYQATSLSPYLGLFFAQRYGVLLGLDLGWVSQSSETQMATNLTTKNDSFLQFGFSLGFKSYLRDLKKDRIAPYLYVDFFKYFASVSTNDTSVTGDKASAQADTASPVGGTLAFGAEYFVGTGFSIGAEIFGLRLSHVGAEYTDTAMTRQSVGFTQLSMYSGLTLNYRFQVQASVKATDDADDDRRRPSAPVAPQPTVPPPTPEAID